MELLIEEIIKVCVSKKGISPVLLDISEHSTFAQYIFVVSGNLRQLDILRTQIMEIDKNNCHCEGKSSSGWILLDFGYVVVNIMLPETRKYYNLEKIWSEGKQIKLDKFYE